MQTQPDTSPDTVMQLLASPGGPDFLLILFPSACPFPRVQRSSAVGEILEAAAGNCMFWKKEGCTSKALPEGALRGVTVAPPEEAEGAGPSTALPPLTATRGDRSCPDRPETAVNKGFGPACHPRRTPGPPYLRCRWAAPPSSSAGSPRGRRHSARPRPRSRSPARPRRPHSRGGRRSASPGGSRARRARTGTGPGGSGTGRLRAAGA